MYKPLRLRDVDDPGDVTIVVVVAVVILVFNRPGVTVVPDRSTHDACTSMLLAADAVTSLIKSLVLVSRIMAYVADTVKVVLSVSPDTTERDTAKSPAEYNVPAVPEATEQTNAPATVVGPAKVMA